MEMTTEADVWESDWVLRNWAWSCLAWCFDLMRVGFLIRVLIRAFDDDDDDELILLCE